MRAPPPLARVAALTHRLAVLLAAGVAPASAWHYLEESGPVAAAVAAADPARIAETILDASVGMPALESQAWRGLAAAWSLATDAGSPLAPSLRAYAASLRSLAQVQRDIAVALAAPVSTARVVLALPGVGVLLGFAMGFNPLGILFTTVPGAVCLILGLALIGAAAAWNRRLVASAQPKDAVAGLECELTAIAVAGGGSLDHARALVNRTSSRCGLALAGGVDGVLSLSRRAGVPSGELLRSEAAEQRRSARAEAQERAAALSVTLMLPLGLCVLPSFLLLGVVPLVLSVISSTVTGF